MMMSKLVLAQRASSRAFSRRLFSDATGAVSKPQNSIRRTNVTSEERAALRKARKERGMQAIQQQQQQGGGSGAANAEAMASSANKSSPVMNLGSSRWVWYMGVAIPTGLLVWGLNDSDSPPAKLSNAIGFTGLISNLTDDFTKPSHQKLLPDWSQVRLPRALFIFYFCILYG